MDKEAVAEWLEHPVTKALKRMLAQQVQACKDQWAREQMTMDTQAFLKGQIAIAQSLIDADADQLTQGMNDD